jgi:hypothetical protein
MLTSKHYFAIDIAHPVHAMASTGMGPLNQDATAYASTDHMVRKNMRASGKSSLYTLRSADDADDLGSAAPYDHPLHTQLSTSIGSNNTVNPWLGPSHALVHEWCGDTTARMHARAA